MRVDFLAFSICKKMYDTQENPWRYRTDTCRKLLFQCQCEEIGCRIQTGQGQHWRWPSRSGHQKPSTTDQQVDTIHRIVLNDRHLTVYQIVRSILVLVQSTSFELRYWGWPSCLKHKSKECPKHFLLKHIIFQLISHPFDFSATKNPTTELCWSLEQFIWVAAIFNCPWKPTRMSSSLIGCPFHMALCHI